MSREIDRSKPMGFAEMTPAGRAKPHKLCTCMSLSCVHAQTLCARIISYQDSKNAYVLLVHLSSYFLWSVSSNLRATQN